MALWAEGHVLPARVYPPGVQAGVRNQRDDQRKKRTCRSRGMERDPLQRNPRGGRKKRRLNGCRGLRQGKPFGVPILPGGSSVWSRNFAIPQHEGVRSRGFPLTSSQSSSLFHLWESH